VGINPDHAHVLTNRGDSNEPTIRDGDVLLVDTSIDRVIDNAFYIVVYNGTALLKRVQIMRDGGIVLSSDNKGAYRDERVEPADVPGLRIAARLMWFGRSI
jgi:phage repressor protein C with HTH and peptisase S24 domain